MKKQTIKITESQLRNMIREAVEEGWREKAIAGAIGATGLGMNLASDMMTPNSDDPDDILHYQQHDNTDIEPDTTSTANFDDFRLDEAINRAIKKYLK